VIWYCAMVCCAVLCDAGWGKGVIQGETREKGRVGSRFCLVVGWRVSGFLLACLLARTEMK
jgi:hypothetical protein